MTVFGRRFSPAILVFSGVLTGLCASTLVSLVLAAAGAPSALGVPGRFLLSSFSWAAFFAPLYFLCGILLLGAPVFRRRSALLLMFSIVPFLTLSLILRVLQSPSSLIPQLLVDSFGVLPSALLLFLLLALEMVFLLTMPSGRIRDIPRSPRPPSKKPLALPLIAAPQAAPLPPLSPEPASLAPPEAVPVVEGLEPAAEAMEPRRPPRRVSEEPRKRPAEPALVPAPAREQAELPFPPEKGDKAAYGIPVHNVLKNRDGDQYWIIDDETKRAARILTESLREFNIEAEVTGIRKGPVITLFEVLPAPGVRVSKIANLADNIALRLAAPSVRIVAPIPGRHAVGI